MKTIFSIYLCLVFLLPAATKAAPSGQKIAEAAAAFMRMEAKSPSTSEDAFAATYFVGYVEGVAHSGGRVAKSCPPSGASGWQLATIAARYLQDNPALWHFPGYYLIETALSQAFPCPAD